MNKPPPNLDEAFEKAIWFLGFWGIEENARQIRKEREREFFLPLHQPSHGGAES